MSIIINDKLIILLKSSSDRLMSIFLKAMIVGEAIAKIAIIVKAAIIEDSMSHPFVELTC